MLYTSLANVGPIGEARWAGQTGEQKLGKQSVDLVIRWDRVFKYSLTVGFTWLAPCAGPTREAIALTNQKAGTCDGDREMNS